MSQNEKVSEARTQKTLAALLREATCPIRGCDGNGSIAVYDARNMLQQEQCQWCDERELALRATADEKTDGLRTYDVNSPEEIDRRKANYDTHKPVQAYDEDCSVCDARGLSELYERRCTAAETDGGLTPGQLAQGMRSGHTTPEKTDGRCQGNALVHGKVEWCIFRQGHSGPCELS